MCSITNIKAFLSSVTAPTLTESKLDKSGIISLRGTWYVSISKKWIKDREIFSITSEKNKYELMTYQTNLLYCIHKFIDSYQEYSIFWDILL